MEIQKVGGVSTYFYEKHWSACPCLFLSHSQTWSGGVGPRTVQEYENYKKRADAKTRIQLAPRESEGMSTMVLDPNKEILPKRNAMGPQEFLCVFLYFYIFLNRLCLCQ